MAQRVLAVSLITPCSTNTFSATFLPQSRPSEEVKLPCSALQLQLDPTRTKADRRPGRAKPLAPCIAGKSGGLFLPALAVQLVVSFDIYRSCVCLFRSQTSNTAPNEVWIYSLTSMQLMGKERCFGPLKPSNFKANGNKCFGENY